MYGETIDLHESLIVSSFLWLDMSNYVDIMLMYEPRPTEDLIHNFCISGDTLLGCS